MASDDYSIKIRDLEPPPGIVVGDDMLAIARANEHDGTRRIKITDLVMLLTSKIKAGSGIHIAADPNTDGIVISSTTDAGNLESRIRGLESKIEDLRAILLES